MRSDDRLSIVVRSRLASLACFVHSRIPASGGDVPALLRRRQLGDNELFRWRQLGDNELPRRRQLGDNLATSEAPSKTLNLSHNATQLLQKATV
jgi:hypothetical protein